MIIIHKNKALPRNYVRLRLLHESTRKVKRDPLSAPAYQPGIVEKYKHNEGKNDVCFYAEKLSSKPSYSMVLPPPNITGKLHLGHALTCTVQDVIVRRKRSLGFNVLWLPGTDHAGIATQSVVEKYLKQTHNINRQDLDRDKFNDEVWKWKDQYSDAICQQLRILGCSLDWSRQMFTMDQSHTNAVNYAFTKLFKKGLIYRKYSLVNWCNTLQSTVSDIEVDNIEIDGSTDLHLSGYDIPVKFGLLYNFAYKLSNSDEELVVATTMPETMLGDTAVAVHPDDPRYTHLRGKTLIHPFTQQHIPVIFDDFVNMSFGTGAVKITPAHSKVDNDIANKHNLPLLQIIDENGCMINAGKFNNLKRYDCRNKLVQNLDELGLLKKISPHKMTLPICSRSGSVIDHLPKEQWFLSCQELNKKAEDLVNNGQLNIEPEKYVQSWLNWTGDSRDWCISRQLWWGHQIPAYKCSVNDKSLWVAATDDSSAISEATKLFKTEPHNIEIKRDTDVLDTWFSSGIYPFASLGWPEKSNSDYKHFYPLSLMVTGHDIVGFWVHRMVMLALELTNQLPFNKVLLHGIICDSKGAKMSKSKGNVIDPLDVINGISLENLKKKTENMYESGILSKEELKKANTYFKSNFSNSNGIPECGVDALRFTILSQDIKSHFVHFDVDLCHTNKLFCNKIWQSLKYTKLSFDKLKPINEEICRDDLTYFDRWILSRLAGMVYKVNISIEAYNFHIATKALKTMIYNNFCDFYLEATKPGLDSDNCKIGYAHAHTLSVVLNTSLRCLAPFMIHLTRELIPKIPDFETNVIYKFNDSSKKCFDYPQYSDFEIWHNKHFEQQVHKILAIILLVRQLKGFYGVSNKVRPQICIKTTDETLVTDVIQYEKVLLNLTKCGTILFKNKSTNKHFVSSFLDEETLVSVEIIADDVDNVIKTGTMKLKKKIAKAQENILKFEARFTNDNYLRNVPEITQISDKEKLRNKQKELTELQMLINNS